MSIAHGDVVKVVVPGHKAKSYSMSHMSVSEETFSITYKMYPGGICSGYLDSLDVGDSMLAFRGGANIRQVPIPDGTPATATVRGQEMCVGLIAFGVGITECLPVARAELEWNMDAAAQGKGGRAHKKVTLVWATKHKEDVFWMKEIDAMKQQFGDRFQMVHVISQGEKGEFKPPGPDGWKNHNQVLHDELQAGRTAIMVPGSMDMPFRGRLDTHLLKLIFVENKRYGFVGVDKKLVRFLPIGTKEMMRGADAMLGKIGFDMPTHALLRKKSWKDGEQRP